MDKQTCFKYLVSSEQDALWGITVDNVGEYSIESGYELYPPLIGHPDDYYFDITKGRVLHNYQLIYISRGNGWLHLTKGRRIEIKGGSMLFIPPYTWHSYYPDRKTGWQEYWIGLRGPDIDSRYQNCFLNRDIVYQIGLRENIIDRYKEAIEIALREKAGYQQVLAALANTIFAYFIYYGINDPCEDNLVSAKINKARSILREGLLTDITLEEVAGMVNMSYSWFRKTFKKYANVSPAQYVTQLKLQKAKYLLLNSNMCVKEIAYYLKYEDATYFSTIFKKYVGCSPSEYKEHAMSTPAEVVKD